MTKTPIEGASDHRTHEAIYLPDPDGNGIELAADRAKTAWPADLGYAGGPAALDFNALLATVAGEDSSPQVRPGLRMGHLHLHVGDIEQGLALLSRRARLRGPGRTSAAPPSSAPAATTITSASTSGAAAASAPPRSTPSACATGPSSSRRHVTRSAPGSTDAEDIDGGFLTRDPWGTAVAFVTA